MFKPQVVVSHPQALQQVFATPTSKLDSGEPAGINSPFFGPQSLLALEGKPHQRQRKLLTPPLHGEKMLGNGRLISQITEEVSRQWPINQPFAVLPSLREISSQVILKVIFGLEDKSRYQTLKKLSIGLLKTPFLRILAIMIPALRRDLGAWSPWGSFLREIQTIDQLIYDEIHERTEETNQSRYDILSLMMLARDEDGLPMTEEELHDELITLLIAGNETTATALAWTLYWIYASPQIYANLLEEVDSLSVNLDPNVILRLPYLNAVCSEALRIYPVVLVGLQRVVKSPIEIMGYQLEPGTLVIPGIYLTHHREDLYPQPKQFQPERFLERQFAPHEFLPFGGGNRRCIGAEFALFEMKMALATILSHWEIELIDPQSVKPVRKGAVLSPAKGLQMRVTRLRSQKQFITQARSE
ncbi:cytochrome P450 [Microseira sp. BLCC-F43]|uniref:cytochrome P450 n=1 Tax=Microseira sp. BLCC-F43 TaxID=3153602 RepID=UPI0035B6C5B7